MNTRQGTSRKRPGQTADDLQAVLGANRQAVVVIHGVGNQRPMDTLRPFVDAVLDVDPALDPDPKYYSTPEDLSGTFELRRLQSRSSRPRTDYFELYWQHLVPTATWPRISAWLTLLLSRRPSDVPPSLRILWRVSWGIAIAVIALLVLTVVVWLFPKGWAAPAGLAKWSSLPLGLSVLLLLIQGLILNYVGDAAIHLSPEPRNIQARQSVREAGNLFTALDAMLGGMTARKIGRVIVHNQRGYSRCVETALGYAAATGVDDSPRDAAKWLHAESGGRGLRNAIAHGTGIGVEPEAQGVYEPLQAIVRALLRQYLHFAVVWAHQAGKTADRLGISADSPLSAAYVKTLKAEAQTPGSMSDLLQMDGGA